LRAPAAGLTGPATTRIARRCINELRVELKRVLTLRDFDAIHRARIRAKRIRYLLEPFRSCGPEVDAAIHRLTALQDVSGAFHDRAVIINAVVRAAQSRTAEFLRPSTHASSATSIAAFTAETACSQELVRRARREQHRLFTELRSAYLGPHITGLRSELTRCIRVVSRALGT
jgi:CHAD domain-containing protein